LLQEPISWISALGILLIVGSVFILAKAEDGKGETA
jgi:drug/metabolite transporter (DMT)-like permease